MLTNFCINFLLYCVSGQAFRNELIYLLHCQWKELYDKNKVERKPHGNSRSKVETQLNDIQLKSRPFSFHRNSPQ